MITACNGAAIAALAVGRFAPTVALVTSAAHITPVHRDLPGAPWSSSGVRLHRTTQFVFGESRRAFATAARSTTLVLGGDTSPVLAGGVLSSGALRRAHRSDRFRQTVGAHAGAGSTTLSWNPMRNRRHMITALGLGAGLSIAAGAGRASGASDPKALAEGFAATLSAHDLVAFAALFADDYVNHQMSAAAPIPAGKTAKEVTLGVFGARLAAIPDLTVNVEAMVVGAERVAASFVYTGTHQGPYFGIAPTGRALRFTSCDIFEVRGGRIAEHWGMGDIAGIMAQLKA